MYVTIKSVIKSFCWCLYTQVQTGNSFCVLSFKSKGPFVVSTQNSQNFSHECKQLDLQVVATLPTHFSKHVAKKVASRFLSLKFKILDSKVSEDEWKYLDIYNDYNPVIVHDNTKVSSLQSILDAAVNGSTIILPRGHYVENLYIASPVRFVSADGANQTIIYGQITINASGVTVDGFSVYPIVPTQPAVLIEHSHSVSIQNCRIIGQKDFKHTNTSHSPVPGILVSESSHICLINNILTDLQVGMSVMRTLEVKIQSNVFSSCLTAIQFRSSSITELARNLFAENILVFNLDSENVRDDEGLPIDLYKEIFSKQNFFKRNVMITDMTRDQENQRTSHGSDNPPLLVTHTNLQPVSTLVVSARCQDSTSLGVKFVSQMKECVYIQSKYNYYWLSL